MGAGLGRVISTAASDPALVGEGAFRALGALPKVEPPADILA